MKLVKRQIITPSFNIEHWPELTLIVPAYNEEKTITDKIINTACLDYPAEKLTLIIACDGCTDQTFKQALKAANSPEACNLNVKILNFETNRGKVAVLNDVISQTDSKLIALTDSSSLLSIDALIRTVLHFKDEKVGVVGGSYYFADQSNDAENIYWTYQRAIKQGEAAMGAPMGMHGAYYAFRKNLSIPLKENTINDDFILPMKIVSQGYRAIYDTQIKCIENETTTDEMNWKRRIRISAGNVQQAIECFDLLSLRNPGVAFSFFSGKFLRAWMPFILIGIVCFTGLSAFENSFYLYFLISQILGLIIAFIPLKSDFFLVRLIHSIRYLIIGHTAGFIGACRYLSGLENGQWKRVG